MFQEPGVDLMKAAPVSLPAKQAVTSCAFTANLDRRQDRAS